jgi:hypothetical protein
MHKTTEILYLAGLSIVFAGTQVLTLYKDSIFLNTKLFQVLITL